MRDSVPGQAGIIGIALATGGAGLAWVVLCGEWLPALACGAGIIVGLWAVKAITKK